jgi:meiotic recombination protein SPO11
VQAVFRSLVASRYWETSLAGKGVLVTVRSIISYGRMEILMRHQGKGYPDIQTREFVRLLATHERFMDRQLDTSHLKIFALMDFDPDGIAILSTYKHGSISLAHENDSLVAPSIEWLGIKSDVIRNIHLDKSQEWLRMTFHDRRKAMRMLEKPVCQEEVEGPWRRELQVMLMLNVKAEIQILGECSNLEGYLSSELLSHISAPLGASAHVN